MTTLYIDYTLGNDTTGDGSISNPYQTYNKAYTILGADGAHTIFMKRGTREPVASSLSMRSGLSPGERSYLKAYGVGPKPVFIGTVANLNAVMWHLGLDAYKTIEDIIFDAGYTFRYASQVYAGSASPITDIYFRRCEFRNTSQVLNSSSGSSVLSDTPNFPLINNITFERCLFEGCSQHGAHNVYNCQVVYVACESRFNGLADIGGGHGFSSFGLFVQVSSGWTLVGGTTYSRAVAASVNHVIQFSPTSSALLQNTVTPTAPNSGEWGWSAGTLYVNTGAVANSATIQYSTWAPDVTYIKCVSHDNLNQDFVEGTGFQSDDMTKVARFYGCVAYNNSGSGFFLNKAVNSIVSGCTSFNNGNFGLGAQYTTNPTITNFMSQGNVNAPQNTATVGNNAEIKFVLGCNLVTVRNSVVNKIPGGNSAISATIRFDATSATNANLIDVYYFGSGVALPGGVTSTRVTNASASLYSNTEPSNPSPTGIFYGYGIGAYNGAFYNPPKLGGSEYFRARS